MERLYCSFKLEKDKIIRDNFREFELPNIFVGSILDIFVSCGDMKPLEVVGRLKLSVQKYVAYLSYETPSSLLIFLNTCRFLKFDHSSILAWFEEIPINEKFCCQNSLKQSKIKDNHHE